jgi:transposase-like protein
MNGGAPDPYARLIGSTVLEAYRDGGWFVLKTTAGEHYMAGGRLRIDDLECPRCREFRLVEVVDDARGQQGYCSVCSFAWPLMDDSDDERR